MAPERQKARSKPRIQSTSKGSKGRGVSSSRSSPSGLRPNRPQETITRYFTPTPPLPIASERRTSSRETSSSILHSDFTSPTSSTKGPIRTSTAFPERSSSLSLELYASPSSDESSGNGRLRRGRYLDEQRLSRSPVEQHYGGKEYIPGILF